MGFNLNYDQLAVSASETIVVQVDTTLSISSLVEAGKYDWVNPAFELARFDDRKQPDNYSVDVHLLTLNRMVTALEVLNWISSTGYHPIHIRELLAIGIEYKELQRSFAILSVGAKVTMDHVELVPYLAGGSRDRSLGLNWFGDGWGEFARFAVTN